MLITINTAFGMLKKRKFQSLLLGIILMLMTVLLYIGIAIIGQTDSTEVMLKRSNASDSMIILDQLDESNVNETVNWWLNQESIEGVIVYDAHMTNLDYERDGITETELAFITTYKSNSPYDILYKTENIKSSPPVGNEVLINYNFAKSRDLSIGDKLIYNLNGEKIVLVIKDLVVDPQFSNPFLAPNRFFVREDFFEEHNIEPSSTLIGLKFNQSIHETVLFEQYKKELGIQGMYIEKNTIITSYDIITAIIASILLGVAILIFTIVIFVIRSLIKNIIIQQYRQIGVKKVIGYTNKQIRNSFVYMYTTLSFVSAVLGVFIGFPIIKGISKNLNQDIQVGVETSVDFKLFISIVIVVGATMLFTFLATKQSNRIKPVQAIKYGMSENKMKNPRFNISNKHIMPINLLYATKQLLTDKRKTITTFLLMMLLIYAAFIIQNAGSSLADDQQLIQNLFSLKTGDVVVSNSIERDINQFIETLESIDAVEEAVFYRYDIGHSSLSFDDQEDVSIGAVLIYGNLPEDALKPYDGRQPVNEYEIALSNLAAKATGKTVGDYITIEKNGTKDTYLVSGIYNTVHFSGYAYFKIMDTVPANVLPDTGMYWLYASDGSDIIEDIKGTLIDLVDYEVKVDTYDPQTKDVLDTVAPFPMIIKSLLTVFLIICSAVVLNATMMDINESTRSYGILKVIGFSNQSIAVVMLTKSLLITGVAIISGFLLNMMTANLIMKSLLSFTPFSTLEFNIAMDYTSCILLVVLFVVVTIFATLIPARKIQLISPKILISE